jgi:hypothetical protein
VAGPGELALGAVGMMVKTHVDAGAHVRVLRSFDVDRQEIARLARKGGRPAGKTGQTRR